MYKRINRSITWVALLSILLITLLLSAAQYLGSVDRAMRALEQKTARVGSMLPGEEDRETFLTIVSVDGVDVRYTWIAADGTVLLDSFADAATLENHAGREEVREALAGGVGKGRRISRTLGMESYYYARRLSDGTVLRASQSGRSVFGILTDTLPIVALAALLVFVLAGILSKRLTRSIIAPINAIDPASSDIRTYDELAPLVGAIYRQRGQIAEQISELARRANTIDDILGNMREGVLLLDRQERILTMNRSAAATLGTDGSMAGRSMLEAIRDVEMLTCARRALAGERCETALVRDGRSHQVFFSPAADGVIILLLDVTEQRRAEGLRREFTANVTHELRTPLTSISGYAEMLESGIVRPEDAQGFAERIHKEASRLMLLVDDILMLSRLDEGGADMARETVELDVLASEVVRALLPKAEAACVSLDVQGSAPPIWGSRTMLYELLQNLVENGIKYNRPQGSVTVSLAPAGSGVAIAVTDTGIGIPAEHHARIFERFYRVDASRSPKTGGTGLGLSIVKHIAMIHGGTVSLTSEVGKGTSVRVVLPVGKAL